MPERLFPVGGAFGRARGLASRVWRVAALVLSLAATASPVMAAEPAGLDPATHRAATMFQNPYAERVNFGARLEPASGIIHGAGQDPQSYRDYSALFDAAHRPAMLMTYIGITGGASYVLDWQHQVQDALASLAGQPTTLQIGLNLTAGKDDGSGRADRVAAGDFDAAIDAFVAALQAFGVPAWVRIGYEFEGAWNGYSPAGYVSAFRYITERIRAAGLDDVATVWCSAGGSAGWLPFDALMGYYPGDEYVDWWGVDTFSEDELTNPWLAAFYDLAASHRKPVMIGEATPRYVGANRGLESWNRWFRPFFEMVRAHPEIKAVSYINWDWVYWSDALGYTWHHWEDARLQNDPVVRDLYVEELSRPVWIHAPEIDRITRRASAE
jgi:hypothetical protein